jgi:hypothetical protein
VGVQLQTSLVCRLSTFGQDRLYAVLYQAPGFRTAAWCKEQHQSGTDYRTEHQSTHDP